MEIQRIVFHKWCRDPYAKGGWCMFEPGLGTTYMDALRARYGNVLFANLTGPRLGVGLLMVPSKKEPGMRQLSRKNWLISPR